MSTLLQRKIIITCGTGGVGKTTMSAALGIRAACHGLRTVVVTIDPAQRLATSLGLDSLSDQATDLTPRLKAAAEKSGSPSPKGSLHAIMPDTRHTLENFFRSLSPSQAIADKMIQNPIFEIFGREFSGANEYMALERLDALVQANQYDCIILDTPPSRNTIAFLNAPKLLARLFDEGLIRWLVTPANKILAVGVRKAMGVLENLTGSGFIHHLLEFAQHLIQLQEKFTDKVRRVSSLLASEEVGFVMVTGAHPETLPEFRHFIEEIQKAQLHFDGLIVNRTLGTLDSPSVGTNPPSDLKKALTILTALQKREEKITRELEQQIQSNLKNPVFMVRAPELVRDVHSMEDLFHVSKALDHTLEQTQARLSP